MRSPIRPATTDETPASVTYEDVSPELAKSVRSAYRRRGGDYDEFDSAANLSFLRAYAGYDATRGEFVNWLRYRLKRDLAAVPVNPPKPELDLELVPARESPAAFDLTEFLAVLGSDAGLVIRLVFRPNRGARTPCGVRAAVRRRLRALGWSAGRVGRSFAEIRRRL